MPESKSAPIASVLRVPDRFLRSVHLDRDFDDVVALSDYVVTPFGAEAIHRILDGLRPKSGRRAWRITGDYGTGKSSLALVLAHLFVEDKGPEVRRVAKELGLDLRRAMPRLLPVLATGAREGFVTAIAGALRRSLKRQQGKGRPSGALAALVNRASVVEASGGADDLMTLVDETIDFVRERGLSGVLLIIDEMGKLLEHAALQPDREDVFILQRLAEAAVRSGERPFILVGMLHQGFQAYAEKLPSSMRHEWDKVAGRFEEIVFDQPLAHSVGLISGALRVDVRRLPHDVQAAANEALALTLKTGWFGAATGSDPDFEPAELYPLHPTVLPVLVRFFARFGQHERSLFSFLLSNEPYGLQSYAARPIGSASWYRVADFYDYVRAVFGHSLGGASYRGQWARIVETIDGAKDLDPIQGQLLKTIAVLNLIDAEDLQAQGKTLAAGVVAPQKRAAALSAIEALKERGLLFQRGKSGAFRLWPATSVNIEAAFQLAARTLGSIDAVARHLGAYLENRAILARRHYIENGTMRNFELRYSCLEGLAETPTMFKDSDGAVVVALVDSPRDHKEALAWARGDDLKQRPEVIVAVSQPLQGLAPELQDVRCWHWVSENTPELAHDAHAATEVARQYAMARAVLARQLEVLIDLTGPGTRGVTWFRGGAPLKTPKTGGLSGIVSEVCDELYDQAPRIANELLNRSQLSSAAAAARARLIEGMFASADKPLLGIDAAKAPPEKSMYLSVLSGGRVHRAVGGELGVAEPDETDDPLNLRPALQHVLSLIDRAQGGRTPIVGLMEALKARPFGVRAGVVPLLIAIVVASRLHELALYENGTFLHRFGAPEFLRLTKSPSGFEIQLCRVTGVREHVFRLLSAAFAPEARRGPIAQLLQIVTPLVTFVAELPEYTRRTTNVSPEAVGVRTALEGARDPAALIFSELPLACGFEPFPTDDATEEPVVQRFVETLRNALDELKGAYPSLLTRMTQQASTAIDEEAWPIDRARIAARASRVSLAAREPRLKSFSLRLRDPGLTENAWIEALGSFVLSKPPSRWLVNDESRWRDEIALLAYGFRKIEVIAFANGSSTPSAKAVRMGVTRADGTEVACVIESRPDQEESIERLVAKFEAILPETKDICLNALSRLLWKYINEPATIESPQEKLSVV
jgi:hypothetical protein